MRLHICSTVFACGNVEFYVLYSIQSFQMPHTKSKRIVNLYQSIRELSSINNITYIDFCRCVCLYIMYKFWILTLILSDLWLNTQPFIFNYFIFRVDCLASFIHLQLKSTAQIAGCLNFSIYGWEAVYSYLTHVRHTVPLTYQLRLFSLVAICNRNAQTSLMSVFCSSWTSFPVFLLSTDSLLRWKWEKTILWCSYVFHHSALPMNQINVITRIRFNYILECKSRCSVFRNLLRNVMCLIYY